MSNIYNFQQRKDFSDEKETISYSTTESIFFNSIDRNLEEEETFSYNVTFGNKTLNNSSVPKFFKNISNICVGYVIMPDMYVDITEILTATNNETVVLNNNTDLDKNHLVQFKKLSDLPYIIMKIAELDKRNHGTNNTLNESFCVLVLDSSREINSGQNRAFVVSSGTLSLNNNFAKTLIPYNSNKILNFINQASEKSYKPITKGTLPNLSFSFHLPNGNKIKMLNDYLEISNCYYYDDTAAAGSIGNNGLAGVAVLDGYTLVNEDVIILKDQTTDSENGVYTHNTVGPQFDAGSASQNAVNKSYIISNGTVNSNRVYRRVSTNFFRRDETLKLRISKYFCSEEYSVGDIIIIKNITIDGTDNSSLRNFLSRTQGHTIVDVFDSNNNSNLNLYNTICILPDFTVDLSEGTNQYNTFSVTNTPVAFSKAIIVNESKQHLIQMNLDVERNLEKFNSKLL